MNLDDWKQERTKRQQEARDATKRASEAILRVVEVEEIISKLEEEKHHDSRQSSMSLQSVGKTANEAGREEPQA